MTNAIERMVDGVTVRKSFETDEFPVPAVTFEIDSSREDPILVTLTDEIPEEVAMEQIGFHPDYHNDQWTAYPEGRVEFTHEFGPRESLTTIYGVRLDDSDSQDMFLRDPQIEIERVGDGDEDETVVAEDADAEPATAGGDQMGGVGDPDRTNVVREVIEGERETVPGLEDDAGEGVAEVNGGEHAADEVTAEGDTHTEPPGEVSEPESTDEPGERTADPSTEAGVDADSLAAALADELRRGDVSDDDVSTIKEELGSAQSTETRIGHLQSRVSDLEAYSNAIEEFIDEHGSAQQLLRDVQSDLDSLSEEVEHLESSVDQGASERQSIRSDVSAATTRIDDLEADVDDIDDSVDSLERDVDDIEEDIDTLDEELEMVQDDVEQRLNETVADLQSDLEAVRGDVEELRQWRDQLSDVFGAGQADDDEQ